MRPEVHELIESELAEVLESGLAAQAALVEAAGLIKKAQKVFKKLSNAKRSARRRLRKRRKR